MDCKHSWEYWNPSIKGIICSNCGETMVGHRVSGIDIAMLWMRVNAMHGELYQRVEKAESGLHELGLTNCELCGTWDKAPSAGMVMMRPHGIPVCIHCVERWVREGIDNEPEEDVDEMMRGLLNWMARMPEIPGPLKWIASTYALELVEARRRLP